MDNVISPTSEFLLSICYWLLDKTVHDATNGSHDDFFENVLEMSKFNEFHLSALRAARYGNHGPCVPQICHI